MSHKPSHAPGQPKPTPADLADQHTADGGLSFDFRAGEREYRIAAGGEQPDAVGGTDAFDYSWARTARRVASGRRRACGVAGHGRPGMPDRAAPSPRTCHSHRGKPDV